ncbi:MAG: hypothetical protein ACOYN0_09530 [Phycisphaerales bacterium]
MLSRASLAAFFIVMLVGSLAGVAPDALAASEPPTKPKLSTASGPLRIGIIGMVHGHVEGLLWQASQRDDLKIVGIAEPDRAVFDRLAAK